MVGAGCNTDGEKEKERALHIQVKNMDRRGKKTLVLYMYNLYKYIDSIWNIGFIH